MRQWENHGLHGTLKELIMESGADFEKAVDVVTSRGLQVIRSIRSIRPIRAEIDEDNALYIADEEIERLTGNDFIPTSGEHEHWKEELALRVIEWMWFAPDEYDEMLDADRAKTLVAGVKFGEVPEVFANREAQRLVKSDRDDWKLRKRFEAAITEMIYEGRYDPDAPETDRIIAVQAWIETGQNV